VIEIETVCRIACLAVIVCHEKANRVPFTIGLELAAIGRLAIEAKGIHSCRCVLVAGAAALDGTVHGPMPCDEFIASLSADG
jgi:hypothetical protein